MSRLLDEVPVSATELAAAEELGVWVEPSPPAVRGCRALLQDGSCILLAYSILTQDFCGCIDYCARFPVPRGAERRFADVADHFGFSLTVVRLQVSADMFCQRRSGPAASGQSGALLHITNSSECAFDVDLTTGRGSRGTAADGCFVSADDDPLGGMVHGEDASNACLSLALNALGARVPTSVQGPFRALEHGDQWLSHLGLALIQQPRGPTGPGRYVKWEPPRRKSELAASVGHFTAVILRPGSATVIDRRARLPAVREWRAWGDIPDVEEHKWFVLVELGAQRPGPEGGRPLPWGTTSGIIEANRLGALIRRRAARERAGPYGSASSSGLLAPQEAARVSANREEAMRRRSLRLFCPLPPVGWPGAQVPQVPCDFSLELPRLPKIRLLERLNAHPRDAQLHFVEESHSYYIRGVRIHGSVTGLMHEYSRGFDAVAVIEKMRSGRNWPRPDYLRHPRPEYVVAKLRTMPEAACLHDLLVSHGACDAEICAEVKATARAAPRLACLMESLSLSDQEIVEKWRLNKEEAARRGTWMHWTFEAHLNRVLVPRDAVEFQLFSKFLGALKGLAAFRTEWAIFAEHEGLAGSIDFVARDSAGSLYIYDWKRAKNLRSKFTNQWENMKFPLGRLPDCQGNHYRVQLNIYRWMLEQYYGARVAAMYVVCLRPDNGDQPFVDDVPVIPEIEELMAIQRTRSRELRAMASEDAREIDPAGGWRRPVVAARMPYCLSTAANFGHAFRRTSVEVPLELPNADLQRLRIARVGSAGATVTAACSHAPRK
ncbi:unnamed protein product [Prorocentrum cordatum]|uniref:PD-(D/E)XK endonuclease-like domain-containing protein n=1 Tax=Prorocentrum cordatum TaxID=2364126 RepID=A0ABN9PDV3_9DINO|nr:unnamed protein product [Polarella glacialis]